MEYLSCGDICDILDDYHIKYASLNVKGDVDLGTKLIRIDPRYNQDVYTLVHEFEHIWNETYMCPDIMSEDDIEHDTYERLQTPGLYKCLDDYLTERTKEQRF